MLLNYFLSYVSLFDSLSLRAVARWGRESDRPGRNFERGAKNQLVKKNCFFLVSELNEVAQFVRFFNFFWEEGCKLSKIMFLPLPYFRVAVSKKVD